MSRFRFYVFLRLYLALSALVLLGRPWMLWFSMERLIPTQGLTCRQTRTARFLPHGTTSASGPLRHENGVWFGKTDAWAVRRAGDSSTSMELEQTAGLLWRSEAMMDITPSRWGETIWAFPVGLDYYDVFQEGSLDSGTWSEFTSVAVSDDPRVAQVEVTAVWMGGEERDAPAAALAERGVTAWLSPAGDGVWSGPSLLIQFYSPGVAFHSSILLLSYQDYDTNGEPVAFCNQPLPSTAYSSSIWYATPKGGYTMRQLIPAFLLLTLLFLAAAAARSLVIRAQLVTVLRICPGAIPYDTNGPLSDVNPGSLGATAVTRAYDLGTVRGIGGTFSTPGCPITREEAAILFRRYAVHLGRDTLPSSGVATCSDFEGISPWADDSLYWTVSTGPLA